MESLLPEYLLTDRFHGSWYHMFPTVILLTLTYFSQINIKQAQFVKLHTKKKEKKDPILT